MNIIRQPHLIVFIGLKIFKSEMFLKSSSLLVYSIKSCASAVAEMIESPIDKLYFLLNLIAASIMSVEIGMMLITEKIELKYSCYSVVIR